MRCFASPTTSIANAPAPPCVDLGSGQGGAARIAFGALLVEMALKPLAKPLGFYGDMVVEACAVGVARTLPSSLLPNIGARSVAVSVDVSTATRRAS